MTITETRPAARTRKAAGIWHLVMAIVSWYRMHQFMTDFKQYRLLQQVRLGTAPDPQESRGRAIHLSSGDVAYASLGHDDGLSEDDEEDEETYWEPFNPEDWIGSTAN
jgi:hypothetical protein